MKRVFFPGKFQPPHIGHAMTIGRLIKDGDYVIVGITEDKPNVVSQEYVKKVFETIFPKGRVECVLIKGTLVNYDRLPKVPKFDVMVTGNQSVLDWGLKIGVDTMQISRSEGVGCSGTELRELIK